MYTNLLRRKIAILTIALSIVCFTQAQEFEINQIKYEVIDATAKTVKVKDGKNVSGGIEIPATVSYNGDNYTVKVIGKTAFHNNTNINSVRLPNTLDSIGEAAFYGCKEITSLNIPQNLTIIGQAAFWDCQLIPSFDIPKTVTEIGTHAFMYCYEVVGFYVDSENPKYTSESGVLFDKNKTTLIQYPPAKADETYAVPNSVITLGRGAFAFSNNLTSITLSSNLKTIETAALSNCLRIQTLELPSSLTSIENEAFASCIALTTINIPASVTSIGVGAFYTCNRIRNIKVDENNAVYSSVDGVLFDKNKTTLLQYTTGRQEMHVYEVPSTVTEIGRAAFNNSIGVARLILPASLTKINRGGFFNCINIETITCHAVTPPTLGSNAFGGDVVVSNIVLKVPQESVDAYKAQAVWKDFKIEVYTSTETTVLDNISIYPTYTNGLIFINADKQSEAAIYNIAGQIVKKIKLDKGENTIDISEQPTGNYIVKTGSQTTKIVKK